MFNLLAAAPQFPRGVETVWLSTSSRMPFASTVEIDSLFGCDHA